MAQGKFISYLRVSTADQGHSGLGLEGQRAAVDSYLNGGDWNLLAEYVEVESGKKTNRKELERALHHAELTSSTLVIAKLDRLSRNAEFLLRLQREGVDFVAADMPQANNLTIGIMALVAQQERESISKRIKEALAAAKARGVKLGGPNKGANLRGLGNDAAVKARQIKADNRASKVSSIIREVQEEGSTSFGAIAKALNMRGIESPRGGVWYAASVSRSMKRVAGLVLG